LTHPEEVYDCTCHQAGITPRGMIDCMIASVAWRHGASLLAQDADMTRMAKVVGIEVDPGSPLPASLSCISLHERSTRR
jgi:predicted PilT family ATPase